MTQGTDGAVDAALAASPRHARGACHRAIPLLCVIAALACDSAPASDAPAREPEVARALVAAASEPDGATRTEAREVVAVEPAARGAAPPAAQGVAPPAESARQGVARIERVEHYSEPRATRIVLHASHALRFRTGRGTDSGTTQRLHVDVDEVVLAAPATHRLEGIVERVELVESAGGVRVVSTTTAPAEQNVFFLPAPFRLVIDVSRKHVPEPPRDAAHARPVQRVVLDPGHGGHDPGATGPSGVREKDVVLDIAHRAAPLLARELGITTLLTRDKDHAVPLEQRVATANAFGADLFISIHCNADLTATARGVMAFVLDGSEARAARELAARENAAPITGAGAGFLSQFARDELTAGSVSLARLLQRASRASLAQAFPDVLDGGVHGAGFFVLAGARMPAVLFETSFISNHVEEARLYTPRYRQKLADAIVNAVRAYRAGY